MVYTTLACRHHSYQLVPMVTARGRFYYILHDKTSNLSNEARHIIASSSMDSGREWGATWGEKYFVTSFEKIEDPTRI